MREINKIINIAAILIGLFLCQGNGYSDNALRLQIGTDKTTGRIGNVLKLSNLLYGLDNPRVKELVTDLMAFGYSQLGIKRSEVEKMVSILQENKDDVTKARQALYDAGFDWTKEGNKYHDAYRAYKAKVRYDTTFNLLKNYIHEGNVIADIGCGDNKLGIIIVDTIKNTRVIGTDVVDYRDSDYKPHRNVDFVLQTENGKIPLGDNSVDKVIFSAVFHHDTPKMTDILLKEAKRVLKPNGEVIILEDVVMESIAPKNNEQGLVDKFKALSKEERKAVISIFDWHANHVVVGVTQIPMELNYQTEEEWGQTFARAGFEIKTKDFVGIYKDKVHTHPHTVFVLKESSSYRLVTPFDPDHIYNLKQAIEVAEKNRDNFVFVFLNISSMHEYNYPKKIPEDLKSFRPREWLIKNSAIDGATDLLPVLLRRTLDSKSGSLIFLYAVPLDGIKQLSLLFNEEYYRKAEDDPSSARALKDSLGTWEDTPEFKKLKMKEGELNILVLGNTYSGNYLGLIGQLKDNHINASVTIMDYNSIPLGTLKKKEWFRHDKDIVVQADITEMPFGKGVKFNAMYGDYILSCLNPAKVNDFFRLTAAHLSSDGVIFLSLSCSEYFTVRGFPEVPFVFNELDGYFRATFSFYEKLAEQNGLQFRVVKKEERANEWNWGISDHWIVVTKVGDIALSSILKGVESYKLSRDSL